MAHRFTIKELKEWSDEQILLILVNDRRNNMTNVYSPLGERLKQIANNLEDRQGTKNLSLADHVGEVFVTDPDSGGSVEVAIYKDRDSGGLFGIDSSFIEQTDLTHLTSPFNPEKTIELTGD